MPSRTGNPYLTAFTSTLAAALFVLCTATSAGAVPQAAAVNRPDVLLRDPDLHGDTVIFSCAGDLWAAPVNGGTARQLTSDDGAESGPRFSPDGRLLAFTAQYDGNTDVFVMNPAGGDIRRVTRHPDPDVAVGWHPTDGRILLRSRRHSFSRFERLFLIAPDGTHPEQLPLHEAVQGSFSQDGGRIAYNRIARESRTWKRYRGGLAQDVWLYDFATGEDRRLTTFAGTDRLPMWSGESIYFCSDRSFRLNLFACDPVSGGVRQLTHHDEYDVINPSLGDGDRIVYQHAGELWLWEAADGASRRIPIEVRSDPPERRPFWKDVSSEVTEATLSPQGKRALVVARGDVFSVPAEHGETHNLTRTSGAREKDAEWSPDGRWIAWISDQSGEYCLYVADASGAAEPRRLTRHAAGYRHTLRWSPDSSKIAFADQTLRFFYAEVESGRVVEVDRSATEPVDVGIDKKPICDYCWSPDSRFLAWSRMDADLVSRLYVLPLETGEKHCVSGDLFNDFAPAFSADGRHLLFASNRRFDPTFCDFEWEMVYKKAAGLYAISLRRGGPLLLPPREDAEAPEPTATAEPAERVVIDWDGIAERVEPLPVPPGNYRSLAAVEGHLLFLDAEGGDFNRFEYRPRPPMDLKAFSFAERKVEPVISGIRDYRVAAGGTHLVYQKGSEVGILPVAARGSSGAALGLAGLRMHLDPVAEWRQIFREAWRMERDFFYEAGMHGLTWSDMLEKYGTLVEAATCRDDLRFLVGEMIGELNASHTYVFGGSARRRPERVGVGLLGADWSLDPAANRYRVERILRVPDWTLGAWPPLARPDLDVTEGEYLLEVDGEAVTGADNLYGYFENKAGKYVSLVFAPRPDGSGSRSILVKTVGSESTLRYRDWVEHNRRLVDRLSDGKIGYLHLPDTFTSSTREFPKYFYSQTQKQGLIVDGRFNGGGLDPDIFLQRLDKQLLAWWTRRYSAPQTTPAVVTRAHLVCLTNRQAGSGGDMLPMEFQMRGMGPVIGTRTWGGLVGVSMFYGLIDGGMLTAPDYRIYTPDGRWIVENTGIQPDIEVDLSPAAMARGEDAQLLKGVEVLQERIAAEPRQSPAHPPFPRDQ